MTVKIQDFNWNYQKNKQSHINVLLPSAPSINQILNVEIVSEDLRDGLHGVERYPSTDEMLAYINTLYEFGIRRMTVGVYPGESHIVDKTIKKLLLEMYIKFPKVTPIVLCLASEESLKWLLRCHECNSKLEALIFIGSAPIRRLVQKWDFGEIINKLSNAINQAVANKIRVIGSTEHTTQTPPHELEKIIKMQVENGVSSFCIADTIGVARPVGAYRITKFVKKIFNNLGRGDIPIEWHGHNDLGNDISNAMLAVSAGAKRIHTVARGIGERAGNTRLEAFVLNCHQILQEHNSSYPYKLNLLLKLLNQYELITNTSTPSHGPLAKRFNHTAIGIHADAIEKTHRLADRARKDGKTQIAKEFDRLARTIYSAVDAIMVGGKAIEAGVGPWSSHKNVHLVYREITGKASRLDIEIVEKTLHLARVLGRELNKEELKKIFFENSYT